MLVIANVTPPVLLTVTVFGWLTVPTVWSPKLKLVADRASVTMLPVPLRVITRGLPLPLSLIVIEPVRAPTAVGVKVTLMVQLLLAATLVPQVLVCAKSPVATVLEMVSVVAPPLVSVTVCGGLVVPTVWLSKIRMALERDTPEEMPTPDRVTTGTLPRASLVMATPPVRRPPAVGAKVALMVQLLLGATLVPQLLV